LKRSSSDAPVVGHNVRFDLGFLQRSGLFEYNDVIDTYELSSVLMPTASRYNLGRWENSSVSFSLRHIALSTMRV
jgi:ATP-dependent DNA helicase DinG